MRLKGISEDGIRRLARIIHSYKNANQQEWGLRWTEFGRDDRIVTKEKLFKTEEARLKYISKLEEKDNFYEILAYSDSNSDSSSESDQVKDY